MLLLTCHGKSTVLTPLCIAGPLIKGMLPFESAPFFWFFFFLAIYHILILLTCLTYLLNLLARKYFTYLPVS